MHYLNNATGWRSKRFFPSPDESLRGRAVLNRRSCKAAVVAIAILALAFATGCSKSTEQDPAARKAGNKAKKELTAYKELVAANNFELAASVGRDLVKNYPDSPAAAEVGKTLPDV